MTEVIIGLRFQDEVIQFPRGHMDTGRKMLMALYARILVDASGAFCGIDNQNAEWREVSKDS